MPLTATVGAVALPVGAELYLGSQGGRGYAHATLDEARIYDRVLDEKEIQHLAARPAASSPQ